MRVSICCRGGKQCQVPSAAGNPPWLLQGCCGRICSEPPELRRTAAAAGQPRLPGTASRLCTPDSGCLETTQATQVLASGASAGWAWLFEARVSDPVSIHRGGVSPEHRAWCNWPAGASHQERRALLLSLLAAGRLRERALPGPEAWPARSRDSLSFWL